MMVGREIQLVILVIYMLEVVEVLEGPQQHIPLLGLVLQILLQALP
jgi:hypothetical protein